MTQPPAFTPAFTAAFLRLPDLPAAPGRQSA